MTAESPITIDPSPPSPESAAAAPPRSRITPRRLIVASVFILIALITAAALVALALTQERPRWWKTIDPADPALITTAEAVENGMATALTQVRAAAIQGTAPKPWKVFITTDQANAWLNVRLQGWLHDQSERGHANFKWPAEFGPPQVRFEAGVVRLGAMVERPPRANPPNLQALTASLRPSLRSDGSFWLTAETVTIGRLPVPASWVLPGNRTPASGSSISDHDKPKDAAQDLASLPQASRILDALGGRGPMLANAIVKLADGRRVRILDIEVEQDRIVITCQTEDRNAAAK